MNLKSSGEASDKHVGIIYPVPSNLVNRFFDQGKNVFVKYPTKGYPRLSVGHKILFYASHNIHRIVGEGSIQKMELLEPREALEKYRENLFLSEEEIEKYRHHRSDRPPSKKLFVAVLKNLRKYSKPVKPEKYITMGGLWVSEKKYRTLRASSNME